MKEAFQSFLVLLMLVLSWNIAYDIIEPRGFLKYVGCGILTLFIFATLIMLYTAIFGSKDKPNNMQDDQNNNSN